jgi:FMN phosphatase YigB (HAD superfamily)
MKVTENELIVYVDIDGTLINKGDFISSDSHDYKIDYYGFIHEIEPLWLNIEFMKTLKKRGWYIIVHSHNGWQYAKNVVEALNLQDYVDEVKSKPFKYIDDMDCHSWMGTRINLHEKTDTW